MAGSLPEPLPPECKLVVFDFDGTLFHLELDWAALRVALSDTAAREFGVSLDFRDMIGDLEGLRTSKPRAFKRLLEIVDRFEDTGAHTPIQRSISFLKDTKAAGACTGLLTLNTGTTVRRVLSEHDMQDDLEMLVCFEDVVRHKPHPEGLMAIMDHFSMSPDDTVFVGDSPQDFICGRAAGVRTIDARTFRPRSY